MLHPLEFSSGQTFYKSLYNINGPIILEMSRVIVYEARVRVYLKTEEKREKTNGQMGKGCVLPSELNNILFNS